MSKASVSPILSLICAFGLMVTGACSKDAPGDHGQPPGGDDASTASGGANLDWPPREVIIESPFLGPQTCPVMQQERHVIVGRDGSVFAVSEPDGQTTITKCTADGQVWSVALGKADEVAIRSMDADAEGNLYFGQRPPGLVGKVSSDGSLAWSVSAPPDTGVLGVAATGDGVYVIGVTKKALPDQPPGSKGGHFIAKFDAAGKREWLRQSREFGRRNEHSSLVLDGSGGVFVKTAGKMLRLDEDGAMLPALGTKFTRGQVLVDVDAEGTIYTSRFKRGAIALTKRTPAGETLWTTSLEEKHSRTIDPFEGFSWHGELRGGYFIPSADTLYYVSDYRNSYKHRSQSRKTHDDVCVLALDPDNGRARWVRQYRVAPVESPERRVDFSRVGSVPAPDGGLFILGRANQGPWLKDGSYRSSEQDITEVAFRVDRDGNLVN